MRGCKHPLQTPVHVQRFSYDYYEEHSNEYFDQHILHLKWPLMSNREKIDGKVH